MIMNLTLLRLAGLLAFAFAPVAYLHLLLDYVRAGDSFALSRIMFSPQVLLVVAATIVVGVGLRKGSRVAFWAGLLGAAWLIYPRALLARDTLNHGIPFLPLGATLLLLVVFVVLLLSSVLLRADKS